MDPIERPVKSTNKNGPFSYWLGYKCCFRGSVQLFYMFFFSCCVSHTYMKIGVSFLKCISETTSYTEHMGSVHLIKCIKRFAKKCTIDIRIKTPIDNRR